MKLIGFVIIAVVAMTGCMPFLGGNFVARDGKFESNGGIHTLEMQQGTTIKQVYKAIKKTIKEHPNDFEIKADNYGDEKATVWTFSNKYNHHITFYAMKRNGLVYLGISIGEQGQAKENMKEFYKLEDMVLDSLGNNQK
ncbi:hypothetical protein [Candidatus Francisella endociliophora]|nr:hypothetical protein [Francisella sp. FSC1006]